GRVGPPRDRQRLQARARVRHRREVDRADPAARIARILSHGARSRDRAIYAVAHVLRRTLRPQATPMQISDRSLTTILGTLLFSAFSACALHAHEDSASDPESATSCALQITHNAYDGPNYWGTMTVKNGGSSKATGFRVEFDIPSGAQCT